MGGWVVLTRKEPEGALESTGNVLCLDLGNGYMGVLMCKNSSTVHLRVVRFITCELDLSFSKKKLKPYYLKNYRASLVAQWLRICLLM